MSDYKAAAKASRGAKIAKYADGGAVGDANDRAKEPKPNNYRYGWQRRTESDGTRTDTPSWGKSKD